MTPEELDSLARELHHEWESPGLWPRIVGAARPARRWWVGAAVAALAAGLAVAIWWLPSPARRGTVESGNSPLLTEQALAEVESAESAYRKSIDKLARLVAPKLAQPSTPLMRAYAEKLVVLDAAITTLKAELARNGFNTHLHRQMAAIYREKQVTLEQVQQHE